MTTGAGVTIVTGAGAGSDFLSARIKAAAAAWRRNASHDERRRIEIDHLKTTWLHDDHWAAAERALTRSTS